MNILVCGDRHWGDRHLMETVLSGFDGIPNVKLISGECSGADDLAIRIAKAVGWDWQVFEAQWDTYGTAAGPIRNEGMLKTGKPDVVIAFHDNIEKSKGTKHMVTIARKAGVPVLLIRRKVCIDEID